MRRLAGGSCRNWSRGSDRLRLTRNWTRSSDRLRLTSDNHRALRKSVMAVGLVEIRVEHPIECNFNARSKIALIIDGNASEHHTPRRRRTPWVLVGIEYPYA